MSLQPLDKADAHPRGKIRVFPESFVSPAPARVSENIDVGRPKGQSFINIPVVILLLHIELCPALRGDGICHLLHKILVKGRRQRDCLRKHRGNTCPRHTVKRLVPPVIRFNSQPFYCRRPVQRLGHLFFQCHLRHKRFRPFSVRHKLLFIFHDIHKNPILSVLFAPYDRLLHAALPCYTLKQLPPTNSLQMELLGRLSLLTPKK